MPLPPAVITTATGIVGSSIGKISKPLADTIIAIIVEYGPKKQAEAAIKQAVAKVAPFAVGAVTTAISFAIAYTAMASETIRGGVRMPGLEIAFETKKPKNRKKRPAVRNKPAKGNAQAGKNGTKTAVRPRIALPK